MAITAKNRFLFEDKVDKGKNAKDHDLWRGALNSSGYGVFWFEKRLIAAHRMAIMLKFGEPPCKMRHVSKCGVKRCVNPEHWIAVKSTPKT